MPLTLDQVHPGMVVTKDVTDPRGRRLLAAGEPVTDQALRIFRMWGVDAVEVAGAPAEVVPPAEPASDAALARARDEALALFRHTDTSHPAVAALFELATTRLALRPGQTDAD